MQQYNAESICYFYYVDDINILLDRVNQRVKHFGHIVTEENVRSRYTSSINYIVENYPRFSEVQFFDASGLTAIKVFDIIEGELNYIHESISFQWSNDLIDSIINKPK